MSKTGGAGACASCTYTCIGYAVSGAVCASAGIIIRVVISRISCTYTCTACAGYT